MLPDLSSKSKRSLVLRNGVHRTFLACPQQQQPCLSTKLILRCLLLILGLSLLQYYLTSQNSVVIQRHKEGHVWVARQRPPKAAETTDRLTDSFFPQIKADMEQQEAAEKDFAQVFNNENHTITLQDLADLKPSFLHSALPTNNISWTEASVDRQPLLDLLHAAGLSIDLDVLQQLPTWTQVTHLYGKEPVIVGLDDQCAAFRQAIPPDQRFVGVAGQMNTGTNALAKYLQHNIRIAANPVMKGVLWTVPWFKHGWASLQHRYEYRIPQNHSLVMAVVLVKDPYFWMRRYVCVIVDCLRTFACYKTINFDSSQPRCRFFSACANLPIR